MGGPTTPPERSSVGFGCDGLQKKGGRSPLNNTCGVKRRQDQRPILATSARARARTAPVRGT